MDLKAVRSLFGIQDLDLSRFLSVDADSDQMGHYKVICILVRAFRIGKDHVHACGGEGLFVCRDPGLSVVEGQLDGNVFEIYVFVLNGCKDLLCSFVFRDRISHEVFQTCYGGSAGELLNHVRKGILCIAVSDHDLSFFRT